jgi:hypothetical protein
MPRSFNSAATARTLVIPWQGLPRGVLRLPCFLVADQFQFERPGAIGVVAPSANLFQENSVNAFNWCDDALKNFDGKNYLKNMG